MTLERQKFEPALGAADEERLELLGAITAEIRTALARSEDREAVLSEALGPHLELLRHLSQSKSWIN